MTKLFQILKLKGKKHLNRFLSTISFSYGSSEDKRTPTDRSTGSNVLLLFFLFLLFLGIISMQATLLLKNLQAGLAPSNQTHASTGASIEVPQNWVQSSEDWQRLTEKKKKWFRDLEQAIGEERSQFNPFSVGLKPKVLFGTGYQRRITLITALLILILASMELSRERNKQIRLDKDIEWLISLPVSYVTAYAAKVLERTILNPKGWVLFLGFFGPLLLLWGYRWSLLFWLPILGLLSNVLVSLLAFGVGVLLYRICSRQWLGFVLAGFHVVYSFCFLLLLWLIQPGMLNPDHFFLFQFSDHYGAFLEYLPHGLVFQLLQNGREAVFFPLMLLSAELVGLATGWWALIRYLGSRGLESVSSGRIGVRSSTRAESERQNSPGGQTRGMFREVVTKEFRTLIGNKNMLIQTMMPIIILGMLWFMDIVSTSSFMDPSRSLLMSVGIGMFMILQLAPRLLTYEQDALWILYSVPRRLLEITIYKVSFWAGLASIYSMIILGIGVYLRGTFTVMDGVYVLVIPGLLFLHGMCGASFAILGSNPLAKEKKDRIRQESIFAYMILSPLIAGGLLLPGIWTKFVFYVMVGAVILALFQKAQNRVPYLLDPVASPPRTFSFADGLIFVALFFILQAFLHPVFFMASPNLFTSLFISYTTAGAISCGLTFYMIWRLDLSLESLLPFIQLESPGRQLIYGVGLSALQAGVGVGYLSFIRYMQWIPLPESLNAVSSNVPFVMMLVFMAPLFEEILFRGILYNSLRIKWTAFPSIVISAVLFAIVHPFASVLPVFILGLATAFSYEKTKNLLIPMFIHAVYNGIIVYMQVG